LPWNVWENFVSRTYFTFMVWFQDGNKHKICLCNL